MATSGRPGARGRPGCSGAPPCRWSSGSCRGGAARRRARPIRGRGADGPTTGHEAVGMLGRASPAVASSAGTSRAPRCARSGKTILGRPACLCRCSSRPSSASMRPDCGSLHGTVGEGLPNRPWCTRCLTGLTGSAEPNTGEVPSDEREHGSGTQQLALFVGTHQVAKRPTDGPFVKTLGKLSVSDVGPAGRTRRTHRLVQGGLLLLVPSVAMCCLEA